MDDIFLTAKLNEKRSLCISPLPLEMYKETGAKGLGGQYGYFVYEVNTCYPGSGIELMAKAASLEAALRLFEIITKSATEVQEA